MLYLFLSLTILTIISQTIHTYYVFSKISNLEGKLKLIQAVLFCSILSVSILAFVLNGNTKLAFAGAIVEIILNYSYYGQDFWEDGFPTRKNKTGSILKYWRQNWTRYLFGTIIPVLIYIFAEQITQMK